jgi:predicted GTPase
LGGVTDAAAARLDDIPVMEHPVVAVCDPHALRGLCPTAVRVRTLLPGAAVVQYGNGPLEPPPADVVVAVVDPRRPTVPRDLARADIVVMDDALAAPRDAVAAAAAAISETNDRAIVIRGSSAPHLEPGPSLMDTAVLVVEDGAAVVAGDASTAPGTLAAVDAEVGMRVDPRPFAVGSLVETYRICGQLGAVLPVMAYDRERLAEIEATIDAVDCDAVVDGTGVDLASRILIPQPVRRVVRELREFTAPTLAEALRLFTHGNSVSPPMPERSTRRKLLASK